MKEKAAKQYKHNRVSEAIIQKIASGEWSVGEKIPPEAELCQILDVSRVTLRESLKALSILGILDIVQGDGTYVNEIRPANFIEPLLPLLRCNAPHVEEIYSSRMIVEAGCCALAAQYKTDEDLEILQGLLDDMQEAVELGRFDLYSEADMKFHYQIIQACKNDLLIAVGTMLFKLVTYYIGKINEDPAAINSSMADHIKIYESIRDQRSEFARVMMSEHLRCSKLFLLKEKS